MKTLKERINESLITEAKKTKKTVDAMINVYFASLYWIEKCDGINEFINWADNSWLYRNDKKLQDMLIEGGTKDSAAADKYYEAVVECYKVFRSYDVMKYLFMEIFTWINKGNGLKEMINWADSELDRYSSTQNLKDELINGGTNRSKAADDLFFATVEFYKEFNFKYK